ncbi:Gamma-glutamyl cyclotransferase, AIG2-like [Ekhidna lutea]|uniref:Gamma-glutamyl cyclotransferase, AIG2-like n=1 Tax=Ekhidna lutea TaxID=447679 RepID=A0A239JHB7_EKHLU|nr:gamma-glutamylcyclotransferase family protein [Ekhidna lutea]SNT04982.1 Gamma-glutamyl cyclotransferase, AIG2-like [Ekhidna lutea]
MEVFFYGLFMDRSILKKNGIHPTNSRKGYLKDYTLKIGDRASLIPCKNERAYGIIMTVEKDALQKLYAEPSVADYIPEEVTILTVSDESIKATCYNLPLTALTGTNKAYANSLFELAEREGFPSSYLNKIRKMASSDIQ